MNSASLERDYLTCKYSRIDLLAQGTEELPPIEGLPTDPSLKDWGLDGIFLGDSASFGLGGAPVDAGLRSFFKGDGAPLALGELCMPPRLGGFEDSGAVFSTPGVGGMFTFRDSPPICTPCAEELGLIS
jgi:hypothetical protein